MRIAVFLRDSFLIIFHFEVFQSFFVRRLFLAEIQAYAPTDVRT